MLILGESGTGKELVARALHDLSDRASARFVPINCAAIPKELIESELFGHRKGAFTGALSDRIGRFELAHGGTLFLDEIGDLALDMQVKLLRVLQERSIDPIGSSRPVPIDVRIVAATHRDIEGEIASGHFRQDLFYRLNVLPIEMPPLRDRLDDLAELAAQFAERHAMPGKSPVSLEADLLHVLRCYDWPGNVRELSNLLDRFSVLYPGQRLALRSVPTTMLPRGLRPYAEQMVRLAEPSPDDIPADSNSALDKTRASGTRIPPSPVSTAGATDAAEALLLDEAGFDDRAYEALLRDSDGASTATTEAPRTSLRAGAQTDATDGAASGFEIPAEPQSVEQIVMMVSDPEDLPEDGVHLKQHLADIERALIRQALIRAEGNISQTARLLRLQRTTLIEKINKYDLRLP